MQTKQELYSLGLVSLGLLALNLNSGPASAGAEMLPALGTALTTTAPYSGPNALTVRSIAPVENGTRIILEGAQPFSPRVQAFSRPSATLITVPGLWDGSSAHYTDVRQNGVYNVRTAITRENGRSTLRLVANSRQRLASSVEASPDKKRWVITLWKPGYQPSASDVATVKPVTVSNKVRTLMDRHLASATAPSVVVTALSATPHAVSAAAGKHPSVAIAQKAIARATPAGRIAPLAPTFTSSASAPSARRVSLDFVNADISEVLKALAMQSGINIILATNGSSSAGASGAIQDKITVSLKKVSFAEALDTVVNLSGYRYARIGDTYAVGPPEAVAALARGSSVGIQTSASIPFIFSDGASLKASIESAFPTLKNRVTVVTIGSEGKMGGTITGLPAGNAAAGTQQAASVAGGVTPDTTVLNGSNNGGYSRVVPKGGVVNISAAPAEIDAVRSFIETTESALIEAPYKEQLAQSKHYSGMTTEVYKIKYASAPDLVQILHQLVSNVYVTPGPVPGFQPNSTGQSLSYTASAIPVGGGIVLPPGTATGGPANTTSVTVTNNITTILLTGLPEDIARAQDVLSKVDIRVPQMVFEAKVVDINRTDAEKLGVNYDFTRPFSVGESNQGGPVGTTVGATTAAGPARKPGFGAIFRTPYSIATQIDAQILQGRGKVLSNPNLTALDGQTATAFIGDQVKYVTNIQQTQQGQNVTTETATVGITLKVTGRYSPDGTMTLYVHPEVSSITSFLNVGNGISLPQIATRFVDTTIRVKDGETIAIGGLISTSDIKNLQKVPFLGDIPFFGELFKYRNNTKSERELVVFLTSRLVKE